MKHIYRSDGIKIWQRYFNEFDELVMCDKNHGMVYIKLLLWYTAQRIESDSKKSLSNLMLEYFNKDGDKTIYSIADSWMNEGIAKGRAEGVKEGIKEGMKEVAQKMMSKNLPIRQISEITGLSKEEIEKLSKPLQKSN